MIKRLYILLLAIVASVGMSWADTYVTITQNDFPEYGGHSFTKDGVTVSVGSIDGNEYNLMAPQGGSFTSSVGNFTKIEVNAEIVDLEGEGWSGSTWTGNASSVSFTGDIMSFGSGVTLTFTISAAAPAPTYNVALKAGTANANKVTLSATSAVEGATITVTPDEEYEITAFSAYYVVVEDQVGSIYEIDATLDPATGAYSFTMPAFAVTIEATIALKPVPEGDVFAGFTATAGSDGFNNEGSANLVDNKFISSDWTKWCTNDGHKSVPTGESESCWWIDFEASAALYPTGYILTTGNDTGSEHGRNPKNWVLKAKLNAGDAWTTIATVTNDVTMKNQSFKDYKFFVDQSGSYKYFRFEVFANQGASVMQLCQLRLIGTDTPAPAPTTTVTWNSSNVSDLQVNGNSYSKEGITLSPNASNNYAYWLDYGNESQNGIYFYANATGGHTFSNSLGKNFTKIEMTLNGPAGWDMANLGSGWNIDGMKVIWTGNASTVDLLTETSSFGGAAGVKSIVFYFVGDSEEPDPTYTVALKAGTANADKVTLSATSAVEGATITVTPNEEYEITAFSAYYVVVEDQVGSIYEIDATLDPATGAYSFTMPAFAVTIEATIAEKAAPAPATTVTWDNTNVFTVANQNEIVGAADGWKTKTKATFEGVTISFDGTTSSSKFMCFDAGENDLKPRFTIYGNEGDSYTFTAPEGKKFSKIEIIDNGETFFTPYGDWTKPEDKKVVWSGTPANAVTLGGTAITYFDHLNSIVFTLAPSSSSEDVIPCTAEDLGKVLCTDGSIYATVSDATAANKTAVAMIAYVDTQNGKALALALADESGEMEWATAKTTAPAHTPAVSGGTWTLASKDDWNNMITAAGSYTALRDGFSGVGGTNMNEDKYWSSTPENDYAWCYYFNYGKWIDGYVDNPSYVRACLAFDIPAAPAAPAYEAVMNLINEIPNPVVLTAECKAKIDAARAAYDALSNEDKDLVTNIATLTTAEEAYTALNQAEADKAIAKINNIPQPVTLKLATRDSIQNARAAYDALTADQKLLVTNYDVLEAAEATMAGLNPGGGAPAGALNGKFTINADGDQIAFAKGNLQATTTDLGEHWTWGFAANQWDYLGIVVANNKITGNKTVSENGTVDLFGWSTAATYYGINKSYKAVDYLGDFVDWGPNMGAGWRTLTKDEWNYLIENNTKGRATVNDKNGYIFLPNDWSGPAFTPDPDNFTTNVYSGDDWTAMENAGAVFLPSGPARNGTSALIAMDAKYSSSTSLNNDTSYVFTIYYNQSQSACTGTNRAYGCMVRLVSEGGGATPLDSAQVVKDLIEAIPAEITLEDACVNAVQAARDAYNALTEATKGALDAATVNKLNQAITDYTALIQAGADAVTAKIAAIPQPVTLKLATRDSIESARAAYDALTADQKALVTNYDVLEAAEATWAGLTNAAPAGALSGKYTINAGGDVIYFAHGNLQYTRENLDADWSTGTFRLATNQYDLIEAVKTYPNAYCTDNYGDKTAVGLFGWGTWGEGKTPNLTSSVTNLYTWSSDFSGTLEGTNTWRTLTKDEWVYLLAHNNQSYATVHGVNGLLVAPDGKDIDGKSMADWVVINDETWTTMQNDGYLFLPACGQRSRMSETANITTGDQGEDVVYYSSTEYNTSKAYNIWYKPGQDPAADDFSTKRQAFGVRLVSAGVNPLDQVQVVKGLIDAIPVPVTLDDACVNAIQAASAAYDALDTDAKAILDAADVKKLTDAEQALTALNQAEADKVTAKINNIPTPVELKLATRDSIESARTAFDALNAAQQALVTNYQTLLDAEAALAEKNPGVSPATPLDSAQAVKDLIDAIPTPLEYPTSGAAIETALNAYDALSDAAKGALDAADVQKLNDAATQYAALEAIAAIEAIPAEIVYDPAVKAAIETAREKYDALSDASKALVDDEVVAKLTNAEEAWAILVAKIEHNVSYIGKDGELKHETVALLHIPDPAPDFNGYEFVRWDVKGGDFLEEGLHVKAVYTPIITTNPQGFDTLAYNGLAQELVKAGVAKEGHIEYSLYPEETESWSAELPKATSAGAYVVYYKLVREGHEDYMAGNITVVIAKTQVSYTAPVAYDTLVYNYNMQTLIAAGQTNDGIFEYTLTPGATDSWNVNLPQAQDAGTYAVYYRVIGDINHFDSTAVAPVAVTIAKRDIVVTAPAAYDTLVYNAAEQTLVIAGSADFNVMEYSLDTTVQNCWSIELPKAVTADPYTVYYRVPGDDNHNEYEAQSIAAFIAQAPLTITAEDSTIIYGDAVPEFIATYSGWQGQDDETVVSNLAFSCAYQQGSYIGTYAINPNSATAHNYAITFVDGTLTVNKAHVYVSGAEAQIAKFADGHANAVVLEQGILNGIKLNDPIAHVTTAAFSSADVAENLTITLFYELTGDAALLNNYNLDPTSDIFTNEGVIIEPFIPDNEEKPEDKEATVNEGIEIYAYGYCDGSGYSLKYHLESGNPDQYKIDFADSRFTDVDWTSLVITGKDGTIDIDIPVDMPTGDYTMTVYFRDSRFDWLESRQFNVTFHVNLPETYVRPLFDNVIALVDTCHCLTDIQWYWRANSNDLWQPIEGANGYYYHVDGKLTGEYFVSAKMNGEPTYTCGQTDMETLYGETQKAKIIVRAYPNPVVNTTTVTIENSAEWNHNIRIVNLMGAEVMSDTFEGNETSVEMGNYPQGNYMISVDGIVVKVMKK